MRALPFARRLAATALVAANTLAHAQDAASAPGGSERAPLWNWVYRQCVEQSAARQFPQGVVRDDDLLPLVVQVKRDCDGRVPPPGPDLSQLTIDAVTAVVRSDLAQLVKTSPGAMPPPAPAPRPPLRIGEGGLCPQPEYPPAAVRAMATGSTTVRLRLDAEGNVVGGDIANPSGPTREHRMLDGTAVDTFSRCRFPATGLARGVSLRFDWRIDP
jgi:TonB family protein